jgi:hypothetical protein
LFQQEIGEAAAAAQRKFYEKFPNKEDWSTKSVHEFINKAVDKVRTSTFSELKKQLPIANPRHTKHFLEQVKTHYESNDDSPEMQQEKLWMLATSTMSPNMKVKWLHRWNQSPSLREAMKFPKPSFSDNMFPDWLHKATWWAQVVAIVLGLRY